MPDTNALNQAALTRYSEKDIAGAVSLWQQSIQAGPNQVEILVYLGAAQKELGDDSGAISSYEQALKLNSKMPVVYYNLGNIHQQLGALEKAAACYQHALAQQPSMALAAYNLGNVCRDQGHLKQAIQCYQHAIQGDPNHAPSYNNLGNALYEQQDFTAALAWFDKAAIRDAESRALYCSYKTSHFDDFRQRLAKHLQQAPHHSPQVATLVAHHAVNFSTDNNYNFCPQPFEFVYHQSVPELSGPNSSLRVQLLDEIHNTPIDD
jgi:tetratricopeptide (TPR) repeat protein